MSTTRIRLHVHAPRSLVYQTLLDPAQIAIWRVPDGMTSEVHTFDARTGGRFRVSLTYESPTATGKTSSHTDTYGGRFLALVRDERIVEELAFETTDPALQGTMTITTDLVDGENGGTDLEAVHEGLPPGVSPADNEVGWRISLGKLAALCEGA
ncbi:MAG: SRPBCC domain-containing protein [Myxococcota bacterium]